MKYAFSPSGLKELNKLRGRKILFAFDFDGTLAPITSHVREARIRANTSRLVSDLARRAPVAAVSGRPVRDLRALVPKAVHAFAGDHGAEIVPRRFGPARRSAGAARAQTRRWGRELERTLPPTKGVWLEWKEFSLCVHYRQSPDREAARRGVLRAVAALEPGPRILPGKCVVNLLNPALPHKGNAVTALMKAFRTPAALYVGDDSNDEDVFALADPRILTLRVGRNRASSASLYLRDQREIDRLLAFFLAPAAPKR
jgi:trehalose 6-phosphate phosphatase